MDHHIPQNDPLVVLHLELHLQDLQHHHNDQVKHLPLNKEPCLLPDLPLQAHPILHMAQQVHPALMGLQVDLPVDLPVVHTVVLLVDHREALQVDLMADLMVDLLEVHQVGHLVDIQVALHLGAHQDILDILRIDLLVLHIVVLPIMGREGLILDHLIKGTLLTLEVHPILDMVTINIQGTLDPQDLPILKPHPHMEDLPMVVHPIPLQVDIQEVPRIPHQVVTHPHLAKAILHHMVNIQDPLEAIIPHPLSIIKAIPHHRRRDMDNTEDPILQVQEVKWAHLIQEVPQDHQAPRILANILVMIKLGEAILVIQVVHLDPILDLVVLLLAHQVVLLEVLLVLVPRGQGPQVAELHPHLDLQQEQHLRPQFPARLNKNRILKIIIIIITIRLLAFSISYNYTIFDLVYVLQTVCILSFT